MTSAEFLSQFPAFPTGLASYEPPKLSHARLKAKKTQESKTLIEAARKQGIFLLNLGDTREGRALVSDAETAFAIGKSFFNDNLDAKKQHYRSHRAFGYKPIGYSKVDFTERYGLSRDELLRDGNSLPGPLMDHRAFLVGIHNRLHDLVMLILAALERQLKVPKGSLRAFHDPVHPSGTTLKFMHNVKQNPEAPQKSSMFAHTDYGSITVLFNMIGGLQLLPPGAEDEPESWRWVKPEPDHAIVIIGDGLMDLTDGDLKPAYHRVVDPPGEQAHVERYSFGYLVRPSDTPSDVAIPGRRAFIRR